MKKAKIYAGILCIFLMIIACMGTAFARYRTQSEVAGMPFQTRQPQVLHLDGGLDEHDEPIPLPQQWPQDGTLEFYLESDVDRQVQIYGAISLGIREAETFSLSVTLDEDDTPFVGMAEQIAQGSALHRNFGDGWQYRFAREESPAQTGTQQTAPQQVAEPLQFRLLAGQRRKITLQISGSVWETSLLQLYITTVPREP